MDSGKYPCSQENGESHSFRGASCPDPRLVKEVAHGRKIKNRAGEVWNWESPAGEVRWRRRAGMLTSHIRPRHQVLELGCGTGYFTRELVKTGAVIKAIDISPDLLELAVKHVPADNVAFEVVNAYEMPYPGNSFDTVVGSSVLHHLDINRALKEIFRVLRPGGTICFTEPNMLNLQIALQKNIPRLKEKMGDSPDETAFFRWRLKRQLARNGFSNVRVMPFDFLHPSIPARLVPVLENLFLWFEKIPFVKENAGSLYVRAFKPE